MKTERLAVVLFNLGGPSGPEAIEPFLFNFFMDKNIINLPLPLRWAVARLIAFRRSRGAAKESYGMLGGRSPLLENTKEQARALEAVLKKENENSRVFVSMRYWHPLAKDTVRDVAAWRPDKIVLLPLYPQYSTTTSFSSLQDWRREAGRAGLNVPVAEICCYPQETGFVTASAQNIRERWKEGARLLFSAHGLPEKIIKGGDPYQRHCEMTAEAIARELNLPPSDWALCYQSRIGPLKWIGPSIHDEIKRAAADGKGVVVYPLAFVSEHVETLVELDVEYKHIAEEAGTPFYVRVPTAGTHPAFIKGLRDLVQEAAAGVECTDACTGNFKRCHRRKKP